MTLMDGAVNAVQTCMGVKRGEKVCVVSDEASEMLARAVFRASADITHRTCHVIIPPPDRGSCEPPEPVAWAMSHSDVVFILTQRSLTHTMARIKANDAGARIASMPGINEHMMSRGGMLADYLGVDREVKKLCRKLKGRKEIHLSSDLGTDIRIPISGRNWVSADNGLCRKEGGFTNLPAGSVFIPPVEFKAEGLLYFDAGVEGEIDNPVRLKIREGRIDKVPKYAKLENWTDLEDPHSTVLSQVGFGMNPAATVVGNILQDEKALGTVHVGFGENRSFGGKIRCRHHFQGIIKEPTVEIDGEVIIEKGSFVIT